MAPDQRSESHRCLFSIDKAFRHGDIENILSTLIKSVGGAATGGGLLGFAQNVLQSAAGGAKFDKGDIKKVYFVSLDKTVVRSLLYSSSVTSCRAIGYATILRYYVHHSLMGLLLTSSRPGHGYCRAQQTDI